MDGWTEEKEEVEERQTMFNIIMTLSGSLDPSIPTTAELPLECVIIRNTFRI